MTENTGIKGNGEQEISIEDLFFELRGYFEDHVKPQLNRLVFLWMALSGNYGDLLSGGWRVDLARSAMAGLDYLLSDIVSVLTNFEAKLDQGYEIFGPERLERKQREFEKEHHKNNAEMLIEYIRGFSPETRSRVYELIDEVRNSNGTEDDTEGLAKLSKAVAELKAEETEEV